jgi:large subunit ribosomal protein L19
MLLYKKLSIYLQTKKLFMNNFKVSINRTEILKSVESEHIRKTLPPLFVGDNVKLGVLIKEGNKERTQYYEGIIIAQKNTRINKTITVRRVLQGIGIERIFLIHSPKLVSLEVTKSSRVRRSKLYYLRKLSGKASRLKQRFD